MKRPFLLLSSAWLLAVPVTAQHEGHMGHHETAAGVKMSVKDDVAARTLTALLGPLNLPAQSHHSAVAQAPNLFLEIPFDGWITAYHPRLVDSQGHTLPSRMLHHVAFWNASRPDFLCPNKEEHIFGAGGEMNDWPALPGFGYRVRKSDRIRVNTMFHNPTDTSYPKAYIEVRMEYKLAADAEAKQIKSVYPTWFDVMGCGNSGYDLSPGKNVTTSKTTLRFTGTLLGVGGHMHDFGESLALENLTRNETVASLASKLDAKGLIQSMPIVTFLDRGGYKLKQGEQIKVTATYQNPTGKHLTDGAMGIVVGYFLPENDAALAALNRNNAGAKEKHAGHP